jgi:hypothetical protein
MIGEIGECTETAVSPPTVAIPSPPGPDSNARSASTSAMPSVTAKRQCLASSAMNLNRERRFRFPKLCTVAGMRRRYPGHKSHGLGKLCELYGIGLETHHRVLFDARATGHFLNLMNPNRSARRTELRHDGLHLLKRNFNRLGTTL